MKHHHRAGIRVAGMLCLAVLALLLASCGIPGSVDKAVNILDNAINMLESQSVSWQNVLSDTRDKLIKQGQSTVANEVDGVLSRAIADTGIEARCYTDFLRDRVRQDLIRIRASLTKESVSLVPYFCNPTPNIVDMNLPPERRPYIEISGYNLDSSAVQVFLVDNNGQETDVSYHLSDPSSYLLTLNLGSNGVPLDANSHHLLFKLSGGGTQTVGITQPQSAPAGPVVITCGPYGGGGGGDFTETFTGKPLGMNIYSGDYLDGIQLIYANGLGPMHGATGGGHHPISFVPGEYIEGVVVRSGGYVDQLFIQTNVRQYGPFGGNGGGPNAPCGGPGWELIGIFGRSGSYVDQLGFYFQKR